MCSEHSMFAKPQFRCDSQTNARSRHDNKNTIQYTAETPREWEIIMEMKRKYREENKNDNEIKRTLRILIQFERVVWEREKDLVCVCEWVYEHCVTARMGISVSCYYQAMSQQYAAQMNVFVPVYGCFGCFWMQNTLHTEAKSFEVGVGCCGTVCVCICCTFCISLTPDSSL